MRASLCLYSRTDIRDSTNATQQNVLHSKSWNNKAHLDKTKNKKKVN